MATGGCRNQQTRRPYPMTCPRVHQKSLWVKINLRTRWCGIGAHLSSVQLISFKRGTEQNLPPDFHAPVEPSYWHTLPEMFVPFSLLTQSKPTRRGRSFTAASCVHTLSCLIFPLRSDVSLGLSGFIKRLWLGRCPLPCLENMQIEQHFRYI